MNGFIELTQDEMMMIDAGGWFSILCGVVTGTAVGVLAGLAGGGVLGVCATALAGYKLGSTVGEDIEEEMGW